ncbi:MAG: ATP-binding protein [Gammaproteobacteria bacterium]|nr:ATP-binding protein [Gammaproteobacteria bacterium]
MRLPRLVSDLFKSLYTALQVNIQSAASGKDPGDAMRIIAEAIRMQAACHLPAAEQPPAADDVTLKAGLQSFLNHWATANPKPLVLFIDEADSLMDELFLALLRQLRAGFEQRPQNFPQSVALAGLRDVRDYRIHIRPDDASLGTDSPFNVKTKSLFMSGFTEDEVFALLDRHTEETGQVFSEEVRREIFRLSQGQPWLTNALANQVVTDVLKNDFSQTISMAHVTQAKEELIQQRDTHLNSLIDKLREKRVKPIVQNIISGETPAFELLNDDLAYVRDLGLIAPDPPVRFANPVYQEIIPRVLSFSFHEYLPANYVDPVWYIHQGRLDMDALLTAFQKFYRRHSEAWLEKYDFREAGRQLLLMAFLHRIMNAGGKIEREMAVGNGRCDLLAEYGGERFAIELKLYRDQFTREDGLEQIARYLDRLGLKHGYLIIFETRSGISWKKRICREEETVNGKRVTVLGM